MKNKEHAYLVGVRHSTFRAGVPALVTDVFYMKPGDFEYRLVFGVMFEDGITDQIAASEVERGNWKWVSQLEVDLSLLPQVEI